MNRIYDFWTKLIITEGDFADFREIEDVYNFIMVIVCIICAGTAAGLTMGLLSLDATKLEVKAMTGSENEILAAKSVLPIIRNHHLLLVTLLLFNSLANETLPIFLGALVPNYLAIIISVSLVLIFGEIIPSALFTGPNQLITAASLSRLVYFLLALFYPIAYPISKILDYVFGANSHSSELSRTELEALVLLQGSSKSSIERKRSSSQEISNHEINLMVGILSLSKYKIEDAMVRSQNMYMLSLDRELNKSCLKEILSSGYSRIPIHAKGNKSEIKGYLLVKELVMVKNLSFYEV